MQIRKGLATYAGLVAAVGQYALAIATLMSTFDDVDPTAGVAPLVTATGVLWAVIKGRMDQAKAAIENPATMPYSKGLANIAGAAPVSTTIRTFDWPFAVGMEARAEPAAEPDEPGDPDSLPEYTTTVPPDPDQGDRHAAPGDQA